MTAGQPKGHSLANQTGEPIPSENPSHRPSGDIDERAYFEAINYVFTQLEGAYPGKFYTFLIASQSVNQAKRVWLKNLKKSLTPEQIKVGIDVALARSDFFPDMADVRRYAKEYGLPVSLPSVDAAYQEAARKAHQVMCGQEVTWSHEIVSQVAAKTGWFEIREKAAKEILPIFKKHYHVLLNELTKQGGSTHLLERRKSEESEAQKAFHMAENRQRAHIRSAIKKYSLDDGRAVVRKIFMEL